MRNVIILTDVSVVTAAVGGAFEHIFYYIKTGLHKIWSPAKQVWTD
jgi:hypothetical protein